MNEAAASATPVPQWLLVLVVMIRLADRELLRISFYLQIQLDCLANAFSGRDDIVYG